MYNWSTDEKQLKKNPRKYTIWKLEQAINFGLNGKKINRKYLKRYLPELNIEPIRREFLHLILYE